MPRISHKILNEAYNGADLFVSLSLYHDEDFGYSPLESLVCGTPIAVTNWGGYKDLRPTETGMQSVNYVPVSFTQNCLTVDSAKTVKTLENAILKSKRSKSIAKEYANHYSQKKIIATYEESLDLEISSFKGFTEIFGELSLSILTTKNVNLSLYERFYCHFWKD
jgi:glycosyltransferase involved in cell wall biosynthesis